MMNNKTVINTVGAVIFLFAAYFIAVRPYVVSKTDLEYKRLLNDAVTQCVQVATVSGADGGTAPNTEWYQQCLKDKGY